MSDERRFVVREGLLVERIDEEVMILDMERNVYFGLDPMGRVIWAMLENASSLAEIVSSLEARYGDRERITRDVHRFVDHVLEQGLIHERAA